MALCKSAQGARVTRSGLVWKALTMLLAGVLTGCSWAPVIFTPTNPLPPDQITHRLLDEVLSQSVSRGWVDYPRIQRDARFGEYLAQLDRIDPTKLPSRNEQLAFWINAYNGFAIKGILDGLTPAPYLGWYRYFKGARYNVGGQRLNLSDVEHEIIRKQFHEPRIHFALVCASASCPALQASTYNGGHLDRQLDNAARMFINDPGRNQFDRVRKVARLSKIFEWFEKDFIADAGTVLGYVRRYVDDPELARELARIEYRIESLDYDWSLNGIPPEEMSFARRS